MIIKVKLFQAVKGVNLVAFMSVSKLQNNCNAITETFDFFSMKQLNEYCYIFFLAIVVKMIPQEKESRSVWNVLKIKNKTYKEHEVRLGLMPLYPRRCWLCKCILRLCVGPCSRSKVSVNGAYLRLSPKMKKQLIYSHFICINKKLTVR